MGDSKTTTIKSVRMPRVLEQRIQDWLKTESGKAFNYNGLVLKSLEHALEHGFEVPSAEPEAVAPVEIKAEVQPVPVVETTTPPKTYSEVLTSEEERAIAASANPVYAYKLLMAQRYAESRGGRCLSTSYGDTPGRNKKLTWRCQHGHIWSTRYALVMGPKGSWCPICSKSGKGGVA